MALLVKFAKNTFSHASCRTIKMQTFIQLDLVVPKSLGLRDYFERLNLSQQIKLRINWNNLTLNGFKQVFYVKICLDELIPSSGHQSVFFRHPSLQIIRVAFPLSRAHGKGRQKRNDFLWGATKIVCLYYSN